MARAAYKKDKHRARRAEEHFGNAKTAIGKLEHGDHVFLVTRGQFGMIDVLLAILDQTGPAHVSIWVWAIADWEVRVIDRMMEDKRIMSAVLHCEHGMLSRKPQIIRDWQERFGEKSVKFVISHAKIIRIWNDDWRVCVRGSCNLNYNPRYEQIDIDEGAPAFDLVARLEEEIPWSDGSNGREVYAASGVGRAFQGEAKKKLFGKLALWESEGDGGGLKTWEN
jgi:hypothetical protein